MDLGAGAWKVGWEMVEVDRVGYQLSDLDLQLSDLDLQLYMTLGRRGLRSQIPGVYPLVTILVLQLSYCFSSKYLLSGDLQASSVCFIFAQP